MDTQRFLTLVRRFTERNFPGLTAKTVTIRFKGKSAVRFAVIGEVPACQLAGASEEMDEAEMQVLGVVPDSDKPGAKARKIAKDSGYAYNSWLRAILRSLRKKGLIVLTPDGYKKAK